MNKTMIALMTAASLFAFGAAQAADATAPADQPTADAAAPAKAAKPMKGKTVLKHKKAKKVGIKKAAGDAA